MSEERWKDLVGWEGYYQVSTCGNVRSVDRSVPRKIHGQEFNLTIKGRDMSICQTSNGYPFLMLGKGNKKKSFMVHRMVALTFIPKKEGFPNVNHKNGIKSDNRVENLEWSNKSHNAHHAIKLGLVKNHSEQHVFAKLKNDDIPNIRASMLSYIKLGKIYGVSGSAIQHIKEGKVWRHVK